MSDKKEIKDIVAERTFYTDSGKKIRVIIGRPKQIKESDYLCEFQLQDFRGGKVMEAWGVDSVQALIIAFQMAASLLHTSQEGMAKTIKWIGSSDKDRDMIGFPVPETLLDLVGMKLIDNK